jgi:hypothetical protein
MSFPRLLLPKQTLCVLGVLAIQIAFTQTNPSRPWRLGGSDCFYPNKPFASLASWRFKFFKPENKAIGKMRETHESMGVPMSFPGHKHSLS